MNILEALFLGIVQGLTEFLPVSSSGHLVLGQRFLGLDLPGYTFEVVVHLGTLFSVILVFKNEISSLLNNLNKQSARHYILLLFIGTCPAVLVGLLFSDQLEVFFENYKLVGITLMSTGILLIVTHFIKKENSTLTPLKALAIGTIQALAIIPGISRSGSTISLAMLLGLSNKDAAKFSFLLSIPVVAGAGLLTVMDMNGSGEGILSIPVILTGFLSSFLVGWISLKLLISMLKSGKFYWFGFYCLAIGMITILS